ncbi:MAG: aldo/keto reductase [Planctomycetes bacterium]|nr:aldo/keto reductase [Planctomycetota bacterium]
MERRPLGTSGWRVSEIGIRLPADAALAEGLARRALDEGVTFFVSSDGAVQATLRGVLRGHPEAVLGMELPNETYVLERLSDKASVMGVGARSAGEIPETGVACVLAPYNMMSQQLSREVFAPARRRNLGVVATQVLAGGALAGRVGHTPPGAAVAGFARLVKPRRTLAQAAILFALSNEYVSCALVRVSSPEHLMEAVAAPSAEPFTFSELEAIFEAYANRYDPR